MNANHGRAPSPQSPPESLQESGQAEPANLGSPKPQAVLVRDSAERFPGEASDRLLTAREVADRLGVSERWVRDHTTRRCPKIRAVKLGSLIRYRWKDVEAFLDRVDTFRTSRRQSFGV